MRLGNLIRRLEELARANEGDVEAPVNLEIVVNRPHGKHRAHSSASQSIRIRQRRKTNP